LVKTSLRSFCSDFIASLLTCHSAGCLIQIRKIFLIAFTLFAAGKKEGKKLALTQYHPPMVANG
jgi:hypothetical protein